MIDWPRVARNAPSLSVGNIRSVKFSLLGEVQLHVREDRQAERHLADGRYDLMIGSPPGNDKYSGSNAEEVQR